MVRASTSETPTILVIGNGMVSWRLCHSLVQHGVHQTHRIVVFGEEPRPAYDRVNLTKYFSLPSPDDLLLAKEIWYRQHDITLHTDCKVVALKKEEQTVVDSLGRVHGYDACVLATGSYPFVPPFPGKDLPNVFVYRTIEDIEAIKAAANGARRGLVIGGGLLGLEAANVLKDANLETCIVEAANGLMARQLNQDAAQLLLNSVASLGMSVRLGTITERIEMADTGLRVEFNQGNPIEVDLVIVATGVRPRDELARAAEIPVALRGGVIVNDQLQSEDPSIYAIGEVASHRGIVYGLVAPGYKMADCLAERFAGSDAKFEGSDFSCRLKLLGVEVSTFGDFLQEGETLVHRAEHSYRSLVIHRDRLIGATVVGKWDQTGEVERAVRENISIRQKHRERFQSQGDLFDPSESSSIVNWPDSAIVCNCTSTRCGALRKAVASGCSTVEALKSATGAGTVCGSCTPQLAELVGVDPANLADSITLRGSRVLLGATVAGLLLALAWIFSPSMPSAKTVQSTYYHLTQIWQDSITKQITGYSVLGISLASLLLSARKRLKSLRFGNYGFWRAAHSWLGVTTLAGLFFHTGLHFGENLNLWLLICFLGLNTAGALTALSINLEKRISGPKGARLRQLATKSHILFFLPYPVLVGFHIAKVYIY